MPVSFSRIEPAMMQLRSSRGFDTPFSKALMRMSVVAGDILVYFPAGTRYVA
jgi:hypothetical protein